MKLFERTGGYWLFWWSAVYFVFGMLSLFLFKIDWFPLTQLVWLCIIILPLVCNPLARWLNMKENTMFDWFKKDKLPANVLPFPAPAPRLVEPPALKEKDPTTYYTIGHTDDNRVSIRMGHTTLMMNYQGVQNLIDQLELYQRQLHQEADEQE
jgi:hypothetical protein